jgi:hypothetical protein
MTTTVTIIEGNNYHLLYIDEDFIQSRRAREEFDFTEAFLELLGVATLTLFQMKGSTSIDKIYRCEFGGKRENICIALDAYLEHMGNFPPKCPDVTSSEFTFYTGEERI